MKVERFGNSVLNKMCMPVLMFFSLLSFLTTQRMGVGARGEIENGCPIYWEWDNIFWHLVGIGLVILLIKGCCMWEEKKGGGAAEFRKREKRIFRVFAAILATTIALLIFAGGVRSPIDDQLQVYGAAMLFAKGIYANLIPGGYIEMYPQQLGYTMYLQLLFKILGRENFRDAQIINCFIIGAIHYNISGLSEQMTDNRKILRLTEVLSILFLPLFLLCCWVYGDLPFFLLELLAARCLLHMSKESSINGKLRKYLLPCEMVFFLSVALVLRKNAWIFILAVFVGLCFYAAGTKKKIFAVVAILSICIPAWVGGAVKTYYEQASGYEINGVPSMMWIAMGMTEGHSKPGWFFNYMVPIYYETECDQKKSEEAAVEQIKSRLAYFKENPLYAVSFYKRKIATQWNAPFWGTEKLLEADEGSPLTGISLYAFEAKENVRIFLSVWQNILYIGALLYCIYIGERKTVLENIGIIYFLGGFLFSILWEGNSRYVLPYVLVLIPYSAMGWVKVTDKGFAVRGIRKV